MRIKTKERRALTDEMIIVALQEHPRKGQAARALGISLKTLARRMDDEGFRQKREEANQQLLREAIRDVAAQIARKLARVVDGQLKIATDPKVAAGTRATAQKHVLEEALEIREHMEFDARLSRIEKQTTERL